jgi:hypothetical protein
MYREYLKRAFVQLDMRPSDCSIHRQNGLMANDLGRWHLLLYAFYYPGS